MSPVTTHEPRIPETQERLAFLFALAVGAETGLLYGFRSVVIPVTPTAIEQRTTGLEQQSSRDARDGFKV